MAVIEPYLYCYPQLALPITPGMRTDARYTDIVRRGILPKQVENPFLGSPQDEIKKIETPIGAIDVLRLGNRSDFERFVQAMQNRCEPMAVPASMGALTLLGVNNWRKIQAHQRSYLAQGHTDWKEEFRRFTAKPEHYKDTLIVVTDGPYSALSAEQSGFAPEQWLAYSLTIRTWHELTHVICRKLWPQNQNAVRDEIVADCIGLLAAAKTYDAHLAERLLGVEGSFYRPGGRLQNYVEGGQPTPELVQAVRCQIALLAQAWRKAPQQEAFDFLQQVEAARLGLPGQENP